jgi:hypothetical protein
MVQLQHGAALLLDVVELGRKALGIERTRNRGPLIAWLVSPKKEVNQAMVEPLPA